MMGDVYGQEGRHSRREAGQGCARWLAVLCAIFSLTLMAGLAGAASPSSSMSASQSTQAQWQEAPAADDSSAQKTAQGESEETATEAATETAVLYNLVVRFLDVGQGDASLVEFPDGKTMLIDTPTGESSTVTSALKADGRSGIDWLVATHPDADPSEGSTA